MPQHRHIVPCHMSRCVLQMALLCANTSAQQPTQWLRARLPEPLAGAAAAYATAWQRVVVFGGANAGGS